MAGTTDTPAPTPWPKAILLGVAGSLLVALLVLAFLWPSKTAEPHGLPVSVSGPAAAVDALTQALDAAGNDAFAFTEASDRDEAVAQIERRETSGAIILATPPQAPEVLTASAAGAVPVQMLTGVATQLQAQLSQQLTAAGMDASAAVVTVTDVVPLSDDDPTGSGLAAAAFPLTLGGMLGGVLVSMLVTGPIRRLIALGGFAVAAGLVTTLVLQTWFSFLQGSFWSNSLGMGLTMLATASFIVGLRSLLGPAGIGIGAVVTVLVGNPLSAAAVPWQFLAEPWGMIGQFMVPGAGNWLLRSLSYFPEASNAQQWWTLAIWTTIGIALTLVGRGRATRATVAGPTT